MITCLEFRRQVLVAPSELTLELKEHLDGCVDCAQYHQGLLAQELMFKAAFEVPVPDELAAELRLQQRFSQPEKKRKRMWLRAWPFALAASFLLVWLWAPIPGKTHPLAQAVVAHLDHEPDAQHFSAPITQGRLQQVLQRVRLDLADDDALASELGTFGFAANCIVDGKLTAHLVVHTPQGAVTVLLMPEHQVKNRVHMEQEGWQTDLLPYDGGVVAVVGTSDMDMRGYADFFSAKIKPQVL